VSAVVVRIRIEFVEDVALVRVWGKGRTGKRGKEVLRDVALKDVPAALEAMVQVLGERLEIAGA
jgi:hypothetical protein